MRPLLLGALVLATAASTAAAQSCRQAAGLQRSQVMVRQCVRVSQATHPPCNAENPCDMIADEIKHSCAELAGAGGSIRPPPFCGQYRR